MAKKLELEFRNDFIKSTDVFLTGDHTVMVTPLLNEDYWVFRIKLFKDQSVIAFPKFGTLGIGFAIEDDWNTNLPYQCTAEAIYNHIKCNKLHKEITKKVCVEAIGILIKACDYYKTHEETAAVKIANHEAFNEYYEKLMSFVVTK